jgi:glycosyltransferase involved in cell wall biosynthesis/ubiquinone/menaquinone biosynthesis C-methylase UbiE
VRPVLPEPLVTVIMPVRNAAPHLPTSLGAVLEQDWPAARLQVLVVDGDSGDGTADVAHQIAQEHQGGPRVEVLNNRRGIVPTAMNLGLARAEGSCIIRVDGHCTVPPDYVRRCTELLDATGADCAGGVIRTVGETPVARAIAWAQSHRLGVGPVAFRTGAARPTQVDTLAFGAYRREVFDRIGRFDEELVRNQDDELNLRLTRSGGTIWMDPSLVVIYRSRATLPGLWRQYQEYGFWKVRVWQKHRGVASWRHLVPAAFVGSLAAATAVAATGRRRPLAALLALYGGAIGLASRRASGLDGGSRRWLPAAFATLHLAYGTGTWLGLWRWRRGWRDGRGSAVPARATPGGDDAAAEQQRVEEVYRSYARDLRTAQRWDPTNPGNRAMLAERDAVLHHAARQHPRGLAGVRVLDVGCGRGDVLGGLAGIGVPADQLLGVEIRPDAVDAARERWPHLRFAATSGTRLPAPDASVDLVVAFTVFSSIGDPAIAAALAADIQRVLAPGGAVVWYDLRVGNPRNPSVAPVGRDAVTHLFPGMEAALAPATLIPPLARRLGPLTDVAYRRLAVGPACTHLVGTLTKPAVP